MSAEAALRIPEDGGPLADIQTAFVDSRTGLAEAERLGLAEVASVRTVSPALALDRSLRVERADRHLPDDYLQVLARTVSETSLSIFRRCSQDPELAHLAIVGAQRMITASNLICAAMMVRPEDSVRQIAVVRPSQSTQPHGVSVVSGWERLLQRAGKVRVIEVPGAPRGRDEPRKPSFGFLDRHRLGRWEKVGYQAAEWFWRRSPVRSPRGSFAVLRNNYLLREAALSLAERGYGFAWLGSAGPSTAPAPSVAERFRATLVPLLDAFRPLVPAFIWATLQVMLAEEFTQAASRYHAGLTHWRTQLQDASDRRILGALTNVVIAPETAALHDACREQRVPLIAFQHGNSRELCANIAMVEAIFEGNVADHYLSYSSEAAAISMRTPFNRSVATAVGLPAAYTRASTYRRSRSRRPTALFISSTLYAGHFNTMIAARGLSDTDMARNDIELVERVLAKIPYRVIFKPYPAVRYPDQDPVLAAVARASNIELFEGNEDVSLLMPDADIVISARATSTIAWGATGVRPFFLIDHPRDLGLLPAARDAFSRAFFLFDRTSPAFCEQLRAALSKAPAILQSEWEAKAADRDAAILRFFGRNDGGAGVRAADVIRAAAQ